MPSFNFAPTMAHQLPPTPPEYKHFPANSRTQTGATLYPGQAFPPRHEMSGYEFIDRYAQQTYANQGHVTSHPQSMHLPLYGNGDISMSQPHSYNRAVRAPLLPPIAPQDQTAIDSAVPPEYRRQEMHTHPEHIPKEEKATGGVAAHLDYEMDQMADFVSETAQGIVHPGTNVTPNLRKYVQQILSSTRLPSSTIILALYLLAQRYRYLSANAAFKIQQSGVVYRMLTTSLLLGSKFLDDNTFQNRSWSEVSNIPVAELNQMEVEWLVSIDWRLHRDPYEEDGFMAVRNHWQEWLQNRSRATEPAKLTPIETGLHRHRSTTNKPFSPEGPIPREYQTAHFDHWLQGNSDCSPPSAPHTGPTTPDYYSAGTWAYSNPPPPYSRTYPLPQPLPLPSQPPSYHHTPYTQTYAYSGWTGHGSSCGCFTCAAIHDPYYVDRGYRVQPIAG